jgi:hypothetical protein
MTSPLPQYGPPIAPSKSPAHVAAPLPQPIVQPSDPDGTKPKA